MTKIASLVIGGELKDRQRLLSEYRHYQGMDAVMQDGVLVVRARWNNENLEVNRRRGKVE